MKTSFLLMVAAMVATSINGRPCPKYAQTTSDVLACFKAKESPKAVNPCIVTSIATIPFNASGDKSTLKKAINEYERNNGFYPGKVNQKNYRGNGMAFNWVKGSSSVEKYLELIADSSKTGVTSAASEIFVDIGFGYGDKWVNSSAYGLYFMDTCQIKREQDIDLHIPTVTYWADWIEKNTNVVISDKAVLKVTKSLAIKNPIKSYSE